MFVIQNVAKIFSHFMKKSFDNIKIFSNVFVTEPGESEKKVGCGKMKKKRLSKEDDSLIGKVVEIEKKYINEKDGLVEVSFQVPCHDWKRLRTSIQWNLIEKRLEEIQSKYNRKNHQVKRD